MSQADQLTKATAEFAANNTDPKANVLTSYGYFQGGGVSEVCIQFRSRVIWPSTWNPLMGSIWRVAARREG